MSLEQLLLEYQAADFPYSLASERLPIAQSISEKLVAANEVSARSVFWHTQVLVLAQDSSSSKDERIQAASIARTAAIRFLRELTAGADVSEESISNTLSSIQELARALTRERREQWADALMELTLRSLRGNRQISPELDLLALHNASSFFEFRGDLPRSRQFLIECEALIQRKPSLAWDDAFTMASLARIALARRENPDYFSDKALASLQANGSPRERISNIVQTIALAKMAVGNAIAASDALSLLDMSRYLTTIGTADPNGYSLILLKARVDLTLGKMGSAEREALAALAIADKYYGVGSDAEADAVLALGEIEQSQGHPHSAYLLAAAAEKILTRNDLAEDVRARILMLRSSVELTEEQRRTLAKTITSALRRLGPENSQLRLEFFAAYANIAREVEPTAYVSLLMKGEDPAALDRVRAGSISIALLDAGRNQSTSVGRLETAQRLLAVIRQLTGESSDATIEAIGHVASIMHSERSPEFIELARKQIEAALRKQRTNSIQTGDLSQAARRALEAVLEDTVGSNDAEHEEFDKKRRFDLFREVIDTIDTSPFRDVDARSSVRSVVDRETLQSLQRAERQERSLVRRYMELSRGPDDQPIFNRTGESVQRARVLADLDNAFREFSYFGSVAKSDKGLAAVAAGTEQDSTTVAELSKALGDGAVLWSVVSGESKSFAMLLRSGEQPIVYEVGVSHQEALRLVQMLRAGTQLGPVGTSVPIFPEAEAGRLADALFGPIRSLVQDTDKLVLIPTGPYRDLPFAVLPYRGRPSTATTVDMGYLGTVGPAFVILPSFAAVISVAKQRRDLSNLSSISIGDPSPKPSLNLEATPFTSAVAIHLPALLGVAEQNQRTPLLGPLATKSALNKALRNEDARFLIIATHGLMPGEIPRLDEAALVLSPESQGSDDGLWKVSEIERAELRSSLTILAACNSGTSQRAVEDSFFTSIADAFLFAGSHSVLVADARIREDAAARLLEEFAGAQRVTPSYAQALRYAMASMRSSGAWSHPAYWGNFYIVGDWTQTVY